MANLRPTGDRIIVKADAVESVTSFGIIIPENAQEKPLQGTVLAVGPGRYENGSYVPMDVKVDDKVLFSMYGGTSIKHGQEDLMVLNAKDVLAIVE